MLGLVTQGKSLALYGDPGTGKSMLLKALVNTLDAKNYKPIIIPYGGIKRITLLKELCEAFDLDVSGRVNLLGKLRKHFRASQEQYFPLIMIDEAHEMEKESFLDLMTLLHDSKSRKVSASLILTGHGTLKKMLELDM